MALSHSESLEQLKILDISSLPSVAYEDRVTLPIDSGVYFIVNTHDNTLLYIGMSKCLHRRLWAHDKNRMFAPTEYIVIFWYVVKDIEMLRSYEAFLIDRFRPPLNHEHWNPHRRPGKQKKGYQQGLISIPPYLKDWCLSHPYGLSGLARRLLELEYERCDGISQGFGLEDGSQWQDLYPLASFPRSPFKRKPGSIPSRSSPALAEQQLPLF